MACHVSHDLASTRCRNLKRQGTLRNQELKAALNVTGSLPSVTTTGVFRLQAPSAECSIMLTCARRFADDQADSGQHNVHSAVQCRQQAAGMI